MKPIRLAAALSALLLTGACGFTPLYAQRGVAAGLSDVEVRVPQTRTGYLLREELDDALARDRDRPARYRLTLTLDEDRYARGLRVDDVASRYELRLAVDYVLTPVGSTQPVTQGRREVTVTYDSADQPYAGVAAQIDSQERAATQAAQLIRLDLARWLATQAQAPRAGR
jgi:LPS-assembly lipoprotein